MSFEGPQIRYARERAAPPFAAHAMETPFAHARRLAMQIEELLEGAKPGLSPQETYSVRVAQALNGSLIDRLSELNSAHQNVA